MAAGIFCLNLVGCFFSSGIFTSTFKSLGRKCSAGKKDAEEVLN